MERSLELLAPAKNLEQGKAAIDHGADALYIGATAFGARIAAGNSLADIEALVRYAHLFRAKVFATVNTLLFDDELEEARRLAWALYNAGVDALIVQDLGLLELDLPPIELHASTQTHNIDQRRVKFLEQVGFKRIILARETSLQQMADLRRETHADLEAFVQGALCVCYSGQCYMSQYLTGRSGNRGACSQPCRSAYDLVNGDGKTLRHNEHLLSLKDFSAAQHLGAMVAAGITSFKIEGRLKDTAYVKNVTAYYRRLLDDIIDRQESTALEPALRRSSSGSTTLHFEPDPERTFNRGFTDYFLVGRQPMASHATQKSIGKRIGTVLAAQGNRLTVKASEPLTAGDGICFLNGDQQLEGFLVNHVNGHQLVANKTLTVKSGTTLWRNNDFAFDKLLQGASAERKIAVSMTLADTPTGLALTVEDADGCQATATAEGPFEAARDSARANELLAKQLAKLGGTPFRLNALTLPTATLPFVPAAQLNELRRNAVEQLQQVRIERFRPQDTTLIPNDVAYFEPLVDYRANIVNAKAEAFYRRHGAACAERGLDATRQFDGKALMTTKYCLRYELGQCLRNKNNKAVDPDFRGDLYLLNNGRRFRLHFDCARCEMQLRCEPDK